MLVAAEQRSGCAVTEIADSELAKLACGRDGGGTGREFHTGRFCCQSHCGLAGKNASYGNGFLDLFQGGPFLLSLGFCGFGVARKKRPYQLLFAISARNFPKRDDHLPSVAI